jgi:hypothetical protein
MNTYKFVIFSSIIVLVVGASLVLFTALTHPDSIILWRPVLQLSAPAFILVGMLFYGKNLSSRILGKVLILFFLGALVATALHLMPALVLFPIIIALVGMYFGLGTKSAYQE